MKKLVLGFVLCCFAGVASAQKVETFYLKNGSIIRGIVVEQVPMQSLKIQTRDGNVFVCAYDEVEKITYEAVEQTQQTPKERPSLYENEYPQYIRLKDRVTPCYQGSIDFDYSLGVGTWASSRFGFSTSHGCLANPYFYAGIGVGVQYHYNAEVVGIPIFTEFRGNLMKGDIKPFLNFRIGYSLDDIEGLYVSPSVGISINCVDFSVGYTYQDAKMYFFYEGNYSNGWEGSANLGAVTFKVGVRF